MNIIKNLFHFLINIPIMIHNVDMDKFEEYDI